MSKNNVNNTKKYAWYSEEASFIHRLIVTYKTKLGSNVVVSSITDTPHESGILFKDVVFIGEVDSWVSSVPNPLSRIYGNADS